MNDYNSTYTKEGPLRRDYGGCGNCLEICCTQKSNLGAPSLANGSRCLRVQLVHCPPNTLRIMAHHDRRQLRHLTEILVLFGAILASCCFLHWGRGRGIPQSMTAQHTLVSNRPLAVLLSTEVTASLHSTLSIVLSSQASSCWQTCQQFQAIRNAKSRLCAICCGRPRSRQSSPSPAGAGLIQRPRHAAAPPSMHIPQPRSLRNLHAPFPSHCSIPTWPSFLPLWFAWRPGNAREKKANLCFDFIFLAGLPEEEEELTTARNASHSRPTGATTHHTDTVRAHTTEQPSSPSEMTPLPDTGRPPVPVNRSGYFF